MQNNFDAQKMMNPLIVQSDRSILMDVHAPLADECRNALIPFAELERSPEHLHTYRLTPLSLWNATSAGFTYQDAIDVLRKYSRFDVPQSVEVWIEETAGRFGKLRMIPAPCEVVEFEKKAGHFPDDVVHLSEVYGIFDVGAGYAYEREFFELVLCVAVFPFARFPIDEHRVLARVDVVYAKAD